MATITLTDPQIDTFNGQGFIDELNTITGNSQTIFDISLDGNDLTVAGPTEQQMNDALTAYEAIDPVLDIQSRANLYAYAHGLQVAIGDLQALQAQPLVDFISNDDIQEIQDELDDVIARAESKDGMG